jgi:hypothetical protein
VVICVVLRPALGSVTPKQALSQDVEVDGRCAGHAGARLGNRLHQDSGFRDPKASAAILLRHGDAEPIALGHGSKEGVGESCSPVALQPVAIVEPGADLQHPVTNLLLLVSEGEVHLRAFQRLPGWSIFVPCTARR